MDIKQLEAFVAVAKNQSFSKAAKELYLTQPTISSHIQNLENEMQTCLFNRNNKSISLTDSGHILFNHAIAILNDCNRAINDIKDYQGKIEGNIDLVYTCVPGEAILPPMIRGFSKKYPDASFTLKNMTHDQAISNLVNGNASLCLTSTITESDKLVYTLFSKNDLVLVCPPDLDIKNNKGFVSLDSFKNLPLILKSDESLDGDYLSRKLSSVGINSKDLHIRAYIDSDNLIMSMVSAGIGSTLVTNGLAQYGKRYNNFKIYKIENLTMVSNHYLVYSDKKFLSPTEKAFLNYVFKLYNLDEPF
nr:LysR family transcriptional regulator [uncultured Peptostreptococcus sp.]